LHQTNVKVFRYMVVDGRLDNCYQQSSDEGSIWQLHEMYWILLFPALNHVIYHHC